MRLSYGALCPAARRTNGCAHVHRQLPSLINIHVLCTVLLAIRGLAAVDHSANDMFLVYREGVKKA